MHYSITDSYGDDITVLDENEGSPGRVYVEIHDQGCGVSLTRKQAKELRKHLKAAIAVIED